MKISVFGTGYVGLITGVCFAELGNDVICVDLDKKKVEDLKKGIMPIYEPGLKELAVRNYAKGRISYTVSSSDAVRGSLVIFIAVGTPQGKNGNADLSQVLSVAKDIGKYINSYKVVVDKSTVPVGTAKKVAYTIRKNQKKKYQFDVVSNPEFQKEGVAIADFMKPDRIVVGTENKKAEKIMKKLYSGLIRPNKPFFFTNIETAELIKYASNAMLAARISFMNELSHYAEKVNADIKMTAKGMGLDTRIGPRFLQAGCGYGGSCFPKDVKALIYEFKANNCSAKIIEAVDEVNDRQKLSLIPKIKKLLPSLKNKKIAVWGLSYKPKTDDIREAPSILNIKRLLSAGAKIQAYDPEAGEKTKKVFKEKISYMKTPYKAAEKADLLLIFTEWDEFRSINMKKIRKIMKKENIVDGRNIYNPEEMKRLGFTYISIGR